MKKKFLVIVCGLILLSAYCFSGCFLLKKPLPDSVVYKNQEYKTGFYGDLHLLNDVKSEGEIFKTKGFTFYTLNLEGHHWIYTCAESGYVIYCLSEDWEEERAFYNDPENFTYYCSIGNEYTPYLVKETEVFESDRLDELLLFAKEHAYDPFNANADKGQKKYPMPSNLSDGKTRFYKESKDNVFVSSKAYNFYVINDKLVLLYYYDFAFGDEAKECMYGVDVPDNIGEYFIGIIDWAEAEESA